MPADGRMVSSAHLLKNFSKDRLFGEISWLWLVHGWLLDISLLGAACDQKCRLSHTFLLSTEWQPLSCWSLCLFQENRHYICPPQAYFWILLLAIFPQLHWTFDFQLGVEISTGIISINHPIGRTHRIDHFGIHHSG